MEKFKGFKKKNNNYRHVSIPEDELEWLVIKNIQKVERDMIVFSNQYRINEGIIDIIARDKKNVLCIIELKTIVDCNDIIFQSMYYPTQFNEKTRMITICPNYKYSIYLCLKKLNVETKAFSLDINNNIDIYNFNI